jgi:hypothetical protein
MKNKSPIEVPVLFIGFNRPKVIQRTIDKVRESKPRNMYFACDGARANIPEETMLVEEVRTIMKSIDWECSKHYLFNEVNKGCEVTVSSAISWVLESNEYVIVLEDDNIAPYSFLNFAQDMLLKYKDEESVYMISSDNYTPIEPPNKEDYLFSIYGHIWGWATWKRAWKNFDLNINDYDTIIQNIDNLQYPKDLKLQLLSLAKRLKKTEKSQITWDIIWYYIRLRDLGLSIVPKSQLSSNIGIYGLHSRGGCKNNFLPYDEDFVATNHPKMIMRNIAYDEFHYKSFLRKPPFIIWTFKRIVSFIRRNTFNSAIKEIIKKIKR